MYKIAQKIIYFKDLNSTNDYLISLYKKFHIKENLVIVALNQHEGRGRRENKWFSDQASLTFSLSLELSNNINSWALSMAVSLNLIKLLSAHSIKAIIKYPNDILCKNKKIAGILTETISIKNHRYCVVGIGLNVNNIKFPKDVSNAISMQQIISKSVNKDLVLSSFLLDLELILNNNNNIKEDYINHLYGFKKFIPSLYRGTFSRIQIIDIDNNGFVKILTQESIMKTVRYEDIRFLIN